MATTADDVEPAYEMTYSGYYLHDDACGLQESGHEIQKRFITVMKAAAERLDVDVDVCATGCGCSHRPDEAAYYRWTAQGSAEEYVMVEYSVVDEDAELTDGELARNLVDTAEELGVPVDWDNSTATCVCLGSSDRFTDLEPGTRVMKEQYRSQKTGVVVDRSILDSRPEFRVVRKHGTFGRVDHVAGEFDDRDRAEEYMEFKNEQADDEDVEYAIRTRRGAAGRSGENLVLWDGDSSFTVERTMNLVCQ